MRHGANEQHRPAQQPLVPVPLNRPRRVGALDAVDKFDRPKNHTPRKRLLRQPERVVVKAARRLQRLRILRGLDPQPASVIRAPRPVLDVLAGDEDRGSPRLPDGQDRLHLTKSVAGVQDDESEGANQRLNGEAHREGMARRIGYGHQRLTRKRRSRQLLRSI
jgi:hypothetical protein